LLHHDISHISTLQRHAARNIMVTYLYCPPLARKLVPPKRYEY
jgi:hypothetical protein